MIGIAEALKALRPNSTFSVTGKRIKWSDPDNELFNLFYKQH